MTGGLTYLSAKLYDKLIKKQISVKKLVNVNKTHVFGK